MTWFAFLTALLRLFAALANYASQRRLISATEAKIIADTLKGQADEIDIGRKARADQRVADADGVRDDGDEFRRD